MKTITLKFVVDENDKKDIDKDIQKALENELNLIPLFGWYDKKSTKNEIAWRKRYDNRNELDGLKI